MPDVKIGRLFASLDLDGATFFDTTKKAQASLDQMSARMDRAKRSVTGVGDDFGIAQRKAENLAEAGLAKLSGVGGPLVDMFIDLAGATKLGGAALSFLGVAASIAGATLVSMKLGDAIDELIRYGETTEQAIARIEKWNKAQKEFSENRAKLTAVTRENAQALVQAEAQVTAAVLRRSDRAVEAAAVEQRAALSAIDAREREAEVKLAQAQREAGYFDDTMRREREVAELHERYAKERALVDEKTGEQVRQVREANFERTLAMEQQVTEATAARQQAELTAQAAVQTARGDATAATLTNVQRETAAVLDAAQKQTTTWEAALRKRTIDETTFQQLRVEQEKTTAAQIAAIQTKAQAARFEAIFKSPTQLGAMPEAPDLAAITAAVNATRAAQATLQAVGRAGPGSQLFGEGGAGSIQAQIRQYNERVAITKAQTEQERRLSDAMQTQEKIAERPRMIEGLQAVRALGQDVTQQTESLAAAEKAGLASSDQIWQEKRRTAAAFRDRLNEIRTQFAGTPSVVQAANDALGSLDFGSLDEAAGRFQQRFGDAWTTFTQGAKGATAEVFYFDDELRQLPPSVDQAVRKIGGLTDAYSRVAWSIYDARVQAAAFASEQET